MTRKRWISLMVAALLMIAGAAFLPGRPFASAAGPAAPAAQRQDCADQQEDDVREAARPGPDEDRVELQCGDQSEDGPSDETVGREEDDGPEAREPLYSGTVVVDDAGTEDRSEAEEAALLADRATLSAQEAEAAALAANPGATVLRSELDNENGVLVYSVELDNGAEVKVDAGNGAILHTETEAESGE